MVKLVEAIVVLTLLVFSFFIGVKYSESVKSHASWLFESKEEEVELPDLLNENNSEILNGEMQDGAAMDAIIEAPSDSSVGIDESATPEVANPVVKPTVKK